MNELDTTPDTEVASDTTVDTFGTGLSSSTMELIQARIAAHEAEPDDEDVADDEVDDVAVADEPAAEAPVAAVPEALATPAAAPPEHDKREAEIAARLEALEAREAKAATIAARRGLFLDEPVKALREQMAESLGVDVDHPSVKAHLIDIVTEISSQELGIEGASRTTAESQVRTLTRQLVSWKQEQHAAEEKRAKEAESAKVASQRESAVVYLDSQIKSAAEMFPALSLVEAPGAAILARVEQARRDGKALTWEDAARAAEQEIQSTLEKFSPALRTKQQATPATTAASESKQSSTKSGIKSASISTADASTSTATTRVEPVSGDEAIAQTIARIKAQRRKS